MSQHSLLCKKIQKIKNYIVMICKKKWFRAIFSTINYNLLQFHTMIYRHHKQLRQIIP